MDWQYRQEQEGIKIIRTISCDAQKLLRRRRRGGGGNERASAPARGRTAIGNAVTPTAHMLRRISISHKNSDALE